MKRFLRWWFDDFMAGYCGGAAFVGLGMTWSALAASLGAVVACAVIEALVKE